MPVSFDEIPRGMYEHQMQMVSLYFVSLFSLSGNRHDHQDDSQYDVQSFKVATTHFPSMVGCDPVRETLIRRGSLRGRTLTRMSHAGRNRSTGPLFPSRWIAKVPPSSVSRLENRWHHPNDTSTFR